MTTDTAPSVATGSRYLALWAAVPREFAYLFIAFPISVVLFSVTVALFSAGIGTLFTFFIGVVLLVAALYVSRGAGTLDLALLRFAGRPPIRKPEWLDARARTGFLGWLRSLFGNGHYWMYLLHTMVVNFIVTTVTWSIAITWAATALGGLTFWFWNGLIPNQDRDWYFSEWFLGTVLRQPLPANSEAVDTLLYLLLGVVFAVTLPFVTRGLTTVHWLVARGMLGAFKSDSLEREVASLSESRTAAVAAEGTALRRLERDIHDGPQQRLVRMQMDLAAAERQLDVDPDAARRLIEEARQHSKDALEELRALSRGFAPPILLDRGLVAALESLAVRTATTVRVVSELPEGIEFPTEIERNAYFVAAEGMTNAVKHGGSSVEVRIATRRVPETDEVWLELTVTDSGAGGAVTVPGHGLAGLEERLRGLGGTLDVVSPAGGPTVLTARIPLTRAV